LENNAFYVALSLLVNLDATLFQIVALSLQVSLLAVLIAAVLGFPLGAAVALWHFPGRGGVIVALNALTGSTTRCSRTYSVFTALPGGPVGRIGGCSSRPAPW